MPKPGAEIIRFEITTSYFLEERDDVEVGTSKSQMPDAFAPVNSPPLALILDRHVVFPPTKQTIIFKLTLQYIFANR